MCANRIEAWPGRRRAMPSLPRALASVDGASCPLAPGVAKAPGAIPTGVMMLATETCSRVVDRAIQVLGAAGCALDNPLAHWYNSQRMARVYEGPTEVHKNRVLARQLLA